MEVPLWNWVRTSDSEGFCAPILGQLAYNPARTVRGLWTKRVAANLALDKASFAKEILDLITVFLNIRIDL